jgi:hypothetical protein
MKQPELKLSDILDYFAEMSETLAKAARLNGLQALARLYDMAALEARTELKPLSPTKQAFS